MLHLAKAKSVKGKSTGFVFFFSDYLVWHYNKADIVPDIDHSMITWKLEFDKSIKHNSFWKFNCSLLKDKQYVDEINTEMQNVLDNYAAEHYDKSYLHDVPKSETELKVSDYF